MSEILRVDLTSRIGSRQRPFVADARRGLNASLSSGPTPEAQIEMARADALNGDLDRARDSIRKILASQPNNFEVLGVYAYIETYSRDYPVPAEALSPRAGYRGLTRLARSLE